METIAQKRMKTKYNIGDKIIAELTISRIEIIGNNVSYYFSEDMEQMPMLERDISDQGVFTLRKRVITD